MFDNPFDSFHNAVAEAKEEREQLDRLLTISTPREQLLVIAIAVTITAFAVWLFLGQVTQSVSIDGTLTSASEATQTTDTSTRVRVSAQSSWLTRKEIHQISPGLGAAIEITTVQGETARINGKVVDIVAARVGDELKSSRSPAETGLYRVFFMSDNEVDTTGITDRNCRIVIELDRQSPISLFGLKRA